MLPTNDTIELTGVRSAGDDRKVVRSRATVVPPQAHRIAIFPQCQRRTLTRPRRSAGAPADLRAHDARADLQLHGAAEADDALSRALEQMDPEARRARR
jgi:hypothetical protein